MTNLFPAVATGAGASFLLALFVMFNIGMQLKLEVFRDWSVVALALLVTLIAILTKLVACGLGAWGLGWRGAGQVGMGMVPRGEVGIVVAQIGLGLTVINQSLYGVVLVMAVATTLIAPPFLRILYASEITKNEKPVARA
jgi:Na+:H+ antiporter